MSVVDQINNPQKNCSPGLQKAQSDHALKLPESYDNLAVVRGRIQQNM